MQKIITSGFGWSGSSAVRQYLRNYPGLSFAPEKKFVRIEYNKWVADGFNNTEEYRKVADKAIEDHAFKRWGDVKAGIFDNLVFAWKIRAAELINNAVLIVVKRDPRSQFAAIKREATKNATFSNITLKNFISIYKSRHEAYKKGTKYVKRNPIYEVSIEDFRLNPQTRADILVKCGLDPSRMGKITHKMYSLYDSIYLHEKHPDKGEIRAIESGLKEYLYDF